MTVKLIVTDGDGTLWEYNNEPFKSSWDALPEILPKEQKDKWFLLRDSFFRDFEAKEHSYSKWFNDQLGILKGNSFLDVEKFLFPVPYSAGAKEFFPSLNIKKGILSSGVSFVADKAKEELGMDFAFSNILNVDKGIFTGDGELVLDLEGKGDMIRRIAKENRVKLSEVCFIGDNSNDIPALEIVGHPFAFNPKDKNMNKFNSITNFNELKEILKI